MLIDSLLETAEQVLSGRLRRCVVIGSVLAIQTRTAVRVVAVKIRIVHIRISSSSKKLIIHLLFSLSIDFLLLDSKFLIAYLFLEPHALFYMLFLG